jgi:uncharacterized protein (TIGR03067 family)
MTRCLALVLLAGLAAGADSPADQAKQLEGEWQVIAAHYNGQAVPDAVAKERKLVFKGDVFTVFIGADKKRVLKFKLDPKLKPKGFDVISPERNETAEGIYELKGDDLKLCYGNPGDARPTEFVSTPDSRLFLLVMKRVKK